MYEDIEISDWTGAKVADRFSGDADAKVVEIKGQVLESHAEGLVDEGEITVTCKAVRLQQFANAVGATAVIPGAVITLVRGEDEGKAAGWRWIVEPPLGQGSLEELSAV